MEKKNNLLFFHIINQVVQLKIDYYSDKVVIYLIGKKIKLENSSIKELLTNIFDVLVNDYDFEINNNYNINIYINEVYGTYKFKCNE